MGFAMVRELSISTIGSRPIDSASATASGMELIGPTGIESARILVIQNSAVAVAKVVLSAAMSSFRCATRSLFFAYF